MSWPGRLNLPAPAVDDGSRTFFFQNLIIQGAQSQRFGSKTSIPDEKWTKSDITCQCCPESHLNADRDGKKKYSPPRNVLKVSMP